MKDDSVEVLDDGNDPDGLTRRRFFAGVGAGALITTAGGGTVVFMQYLEPNVLYEPPSKHIVGTPGDYPIPSVVSHPDIRVYIVRTVRGFVAVSAVCTHLGCITRWDELAGIISCPCHGSQFDKSGRVILGPAPKPLRHLAMSVEADDLLVVDVGVEADPDVFLRI